jgi:hypothetical protein
VPFVCPSLDPLKVLWPKPAWDEILARANRLQFQPRNEYDSRRMMPLRVVPMLQSQSNTIMQCNDAMQKWEDGRICHKLVRFRPAKPMWRGGCDGGKNLVVQAIKTNVASLHLPFETINQILLYFCYTKLQSRPFFGLEFPLTLPRRRKCTA